jgi:hypothetical protein
MCYRTGYYHSLIYTDYMHAELVSQITGTKLQGRKRTKERMYASILCIDDLLLSLTPPQSGPYEIKFRLAQIL